MGELMLTGLDEDVLAQLSSRAAAHGQSVAAEAAAILEAEVARLSAGPKMSEEQWLVIAEQARQQWQPLDVSMVDLIGEGRDERQPRH